VETKQIPLKRLIGKTVLHFAAMVKMEQMVLHEKRGATQAVSILYWQQMRFYEHIPPILIVV
jgi:hypothetical protein